MLTKRQKEVLDFIKLSSKKKGYAPSLEEIQKRLKLASVSTAHFHIAKLKEAGYLDKIENKARSISISDEGSLIRIPLLGVIAAGEPIEAIQERETVAIPKSKVPNGEIYALRVSGNSMIDENINDGDVVIVRNQSTAENGQKVVALIDSEAVTLKKIYKEKNKIRLQPANQALLPLFLNASRVTVQGIVIDVIKSQLNNGNQQKEGKILDTVSNTKKPKGGCELVYTGKTKEEDVISVTPSANLKLVAKHGNNLEKKLITGDNLNILKNLYNQNSIRGHIDLIYIDPPFGTGHDFVGFDESKSYSDRIVNTEFIEFIRKRLILLRELLSDKGSIYIHIDQKIGHYLKIILDEVFGEENFRNDITRIKCNPKNFDRKSFGNIKDVIYFYSKSKPNGNDHIHWNDYRLPLSEEDILKQFPKIDSRGQRYATTPLHAKGETKNGPTGKEWKGLKPPKGRHWRYAPTELTRLDNEGLIEWSGNGNPRKIIYADENRGKKIQDIWDFKDPGYESSLYPTEKNLDLLKQIILSSSPKNGLVLDCFNGSGTTVIAAEMLDRNWIGIDMNENAINLTKDRLVRLKKNPEFAVYKSI
ncbi:transcriptional repressor LexA [Candidatus Parcubacteria bacterium]|nr:transcriptional repressor LexA [Candidatus Parcubacteria bacterium]